MFPHGKDCNHRRKLSRSLPDDCFFYRDEAGYLTGDFRRVR